jgi:hypothetical protein
VQEHFRIHFYGETRGACTARAGWSPEENVSIDSKLGYGPRRGRNVGLKRIRMMNVRVLAAITLGSVLVAFGGVAFADTMTAVPAMSGMAASQTMNAGSYKLVLNVLPAEPFVNPATHPTAGMVTIGGATPVQPGSATHPNHHLVVHVYRADGSAVTGAHVTMTVTGSSGRVLHVPVVEMQVAGKGAPSTHYGNNLTLAPGSYTVVVTVGGSASATFKIMSM